MADYKEQIKYLIDNPDELLQKKPFFRGVVDYSSLWNYTREVSINQTVRAELPKFKKKVISQQQFLEELDPQCHKVLFDQNVPSITMKLDNGSYVEIEYQKMAVSYQKNIKDKQVLHLCGNDMLFTLMETQPSEQQAKDFITFKQYWRLRNQDGMKTKLVDAQLSVGDAGLLYYFDNKKRIKCRLLSFMDGYILCPHNDDNGDRILESVYYTDGETEYIDSYDDTYVYHHSNSGLDAADKGWKLESVEVHGFSEIPLVTKRGDVAWNNAQSIIEAYEVLYNIFNVIQKRHGWGILYIKGRFDDSGKTIAGSVILNDRSMNAEGDAKFLSPPSPQGYLDTLQLLEETIQKCSSTTFILPKDIKMSGDISGIAIMMSMSMDIENALQKVIDYQNVADKMCRLFKEGLAKELVEKKIQSTAVTDFEQLNINASFKVWRPQSDTEFASMLVNLKTNGIISEETATEKSPVSAPDEKERRKKEVELQEQKELEKEERAVKLAASKSNNDEK